MKIVNSEYDIVGEGGFQIKPGFYTIVITRDAGDIKYFQVIFYFILSEHDVN